MSSSEPVHSFLDLPTELADHVLSFFSIVDIGRVSCVSRSALRACKHGLNGRRSITNKDVLTSSTARNIAVIRFVAEHCFSLETFSVCLPGQGWVSSLLLESMIMLAHKTAHLVELNLVNIDLNDQALVAMSWAAPNLTHITLGSSTPSIPNRSFGDVGMVAIVERCTKLQSVGLLRCHGCSDEVLFKMGQCRKKMKQLMLHSCPQITESGLIDLASHCQDLELLDLTNTRFFLDSIYFRDPDALGHRSSCDISTVWSSCSRNLKELRLKENCDFNGESLAPLFSHTTKLDSVELHGGAVTDEALSMIGTHCTGLRSLKLRDPQVTVRGMHSLLQQCKNLREISLIGCWPTGEEDCDSPHLLHPSTVAFASILTSICSYCTCLVSLELENLYKAPVSFLTVLSSTPFIQKLERLSLSWAECDLSEKKSDRGSDLVVEVLGNCHSLRSLRMEGYPGSADAVVHGISDLGNSLDCVNVSKTNLTDAGLRALVNADIHIRRIDISCCGFITSTALAETIRAIGQPWKEVNFSEMDGVADEVIHAILETCDEIEHLNIGMPMHLQSRITQRGFRKLRQAVHSEYFKVDCIRSQIQRVKDWDWRRPMRCNASHHTCRPMRCNASHHAYRPM